MICVASHKYMTFNYKKAKQNKYLLLAARGDDSTSRDSCQEEPLFFLRFKVSSFIHSAECVFHEKWLVGHSRCIHTEIYKLCVMAELETVQPEEEKLLCCLVAPQQILSAPPDGKKVSKLWLGNRLCFVSLWDIIPFQVVLKQWSMIPFSGILNFTTTPKIWDQNLTYTLKPSF